MQKVPLEIGDVVQINPENKMFGGCFMVVTEPKAWGAQGGIAVPGQPGIAYLRCKFEEMEYVGRATWILDKDAKEKS